MKKITKSTTLKEVLKHKKASEILKKYNLPCLSCPFAQFEIGKLTLEDICRFYQIDLKKLLSDLNKNL